MDASEQVAPDFAADDAFVNGSAGGDGDEEKVGGRTLRARRVVNDSDDEGELDGEGEMDEDAEMDDAPPLPPRKIGRAHV